MTEKEELQRYVNTGKCPRCNSEVEQVWAGHERDSTWDEHKCTKCDWECVEMALWGIKYSQE